MSPCLRNLDIIFRAISLAFYALLTLNVVYSEICDSLNYLLSKKKA